MGEQEEAVKQGQAIVDSFAPRFQAAYEAAMLPKIGISGSATRRHGAAR